MFQLTLSSVAIVFSLSYGGYLLSRREWRISKLALLGGLLSCGGVEFFDLKILLFPDQLMFWKQGSLLAESCQPFFWLLYALTFSREEGERGLSLTSRLILLSTFGFLLAAMLIPISDIFYSPDFVDEKMLFLGSEGYFFYVAMMSFMVFAMFHLERTLVAMPRPDRWRIKFEVIGAGLLLTVLVIYYSQALLYRSLDMNLMPVRSLSLALGVSLMAFSRIRRGEAVRSIRISREIAYRSIVILAVGFYLIGLGLFGAGMRYFNFTFNRAFFISLAVLFGVGIVTVLLSEQSRRRIQVVLHKNFYQRKYDYRDEWLQFTARLASAKNREELERGILDFFAETFSLAGAALYLREPETGDYRCSTCLEQNTTAPPLSGNHPLMEKMRLHDWVVSLPEEAQAGLKGELARLYQTGCSFLVPLRFDQNLEGFVALGRRIYQQERLTYEDFDMMKILSHQAVGMLLSHKLYSQLAAANEMAAIGRVSTFVIHDLKNLVSGLAMVVDNARSYIDDPEFRDDMFETLENTVSNMKGLIARLQNVKQKPLLECTSCDLLEIAKAAVAFSGDMGVDVDGGQVFIHGDATELQKVILNLIHNAREASTPGNGPSIEVGKEEMAFVRVIDQGCGMAEEFIRTRLFKPFETTKKKGMGVGLYQCRQIIEGHGGRIEVKSAEGEGSAFTVWLPLATMEGRQII